MIESVSSLYLYIGKMRAGLDPNPGELLYWGCEMMK